MTVAQVVKESGFSKSTVYEDIICGRLVATEIIMPKYTKYEISRDEFEKWIEGRRNNIWKLKRAKSTS